jgi:adenylosuccinate synthase
VVVRNLDHYKRAFVVIGLGYGDEGKGLVTDYLCRNNEKPLVIRFNGGQQAGHTVVNENGDCHVFSNFGAGSLRGIPTYWSRFCTFSPIHFLEEYHQLPLPPRIFIDKDSPVTTHFDILFSRAVETSRGDARHGSCGVGFGATIERSKFSELNLCTGDLANRELCAQKLKLIRDYYAQKFVYETIFDFEQFDHDQQDRDFLDDLQELTNLTLLNKVTFTVAEAIFKNKNWSTYIFEGAQGILLDIDFGNPPHITKSHTTSHNAMELLKANFLPAEILTEIFYVTRAYATKHGAGPFHNHFGAPELVNNEQETNQENEFQGQFRVAFLQLDRLKFALECDHNFVFGASKNLVITCMDQLSSDSIVVVNGNELCEVDPEDFPKLLDFPLKRVLLSYGPKSVDIRSL